MPEAVDLELVRGDSLPIGGNFEGIGVAPRLLLAALTCERELDAAQAWSFLLDVAQRT